MAIALPSGVIFSAVVAFLVSYALYLLLKALADPIADLFRSLPVVGGAIARAIESAVDAIGRGFNALANATLSTVVSLWNGLTELTDDLADALTALANRTLSALDYLNRVAIKALYTTLIAPVLSRVAALEAKLSALLASTAALAASLTDRIEAVIARELAQAYAAGLGAYHGIASDVRRLIDQGEAALRRELGRDIAAAEAVAGQALDGVTDLYRQLPIDELRRLALEYPAVAGLVATIALEAGLDQAACRGKVKNICSVDPEDWALLLAGVGAVGFGFGLVELVREMQEFATPVSRELVELVT